MARSPCARRRGIDSPGAQAPLTTLYPASTSLTLVRPLVVSFSIPARAQRVHLATRAGRATTSIPRVTAHSATGPAGASRASAPARSARRDSPLHRQELMRGRPGDPADRPRRFRQYLGLHGQVTVACPQHQLIELVPDDDRPWPARRQMRAAELVRGPHTANRHVERQNGMSSSVSAGCTGGGGGGGTTAGSRGARTRIPPTTFPPKLIVGSV